MGSRNTKVANLDSGFRPSGETGFQFACATALAGTALSTTGVNSLTTHVRIVATGQDVRYRTDGVDPTAAIGQILADGVGEYWSRERYLAGIFIQTGATAVVDVECLAI